VPIDANAKTSKSSGDEGLRPLSVEPFTSYWSLIAFTVIPSSIQ